LINATKEQCSSSAFPIESLHIDLFTLVIQSVIDDAAVYLLEERSENRVQPVAAVRLALVSRRWRDVIYNTPSLWPVISLDLTKSLDQVQNKLARCYGRSLNAPVDLYLWHAHFHSETEVNDMLLNHAWQYHHPYKCACRRREGNQEAEDSIAVDFGQVTNIQSLLVRFINSLVTSKFTLSIFSARSLTNLCRLTISVATDAQGAQLDLNVLFVSTPRLVHFDLDGVGIAKISFAKAGQPLLPRLRKLILSASSKNRATPNILPRFLSHAPNIEEVNAFFRNFDREAPLDPFPSSHKTITLRNLRRLVVQSFGPIRHTFAEGKIETSILEAFNYLDWDNSANEACLKFFSLNPTIKRLHISVADKSQYGPTLTGAANVEEFSIFSDGKGEFLFPLYTPELSVPICPKVRNLTIIVRATPIQPDFFGKLVRSRCRPVKRVDGWAM
jgi:hypothetical protein